MPNITGGFSLPGTEIPTSATFSGAFYVPGDMTGAYGSGHNQAKTNPKVMFDASRISTIFNETLIVQPASIYGLIIVRI